jgi:hypothetical protein
VFCVNLCELYDREFPGRAEETATRSGEMAAWSGEPASKAGKTATQAGNMTSKADEAISRADNDDALGTFMGYLSSRKNQRIERVYLGSSFCSQYFLRFSGYERIFAFCSSKGIHATLTLPIFSEKDLEAGKRKIAQICETCGACIDEITVNDIGMLAYVRGLARYRINLGRLFNRNPRDCRIPEHMAMTRRLSIPDADLLESADIASIEFDPTNAAFEAGGSGQIAVHTPYCYISTGNICKFASIHHDVDDKFRPNAACRMECHHICDIYRDHVPATGADTEIFRFGRTLYYRAQMPAMPKAEAYKAGTSASPKAETYQACTSASPQVNVSREIYFPVDEWREFLQTSHHRM